MLKPWELKLPNTDYHTKLDIDGLKKCVLYQPNTDKGWLLLSELLLNHCYWN
jgi:hypothetical protein